jgi:exosome complex exonuclease RRP6
MQVFHGADWDIEWLQKDFGLYVVNMFDTHQAAKLLNFSSLSLAFLLKHFCQRDVNKQYQLADWRIRSAACEELVRTIRVFARRPLPNDYLRYAREDTHYLLYIYDQLRNQLLQMAEGRDEALKTVYDRSKLICQKVRTMVECSRQSNIESFD